MRNLKRESKTRAKITRGWTAKAVELLDEALCICDAAVFLLYNARKVEILACMPALALETDTNSLQLKAACKRVSLKLHRY